MTDHEDVVREHVFEGVEAARGSLFELFNLVDEVGVVDDDVVVCFEAAVEESLGEVSVAAFEQSR